MTSAKTLTDDLILPRGRRRLESQRYGGWLQSIMVNRWRGGGLLWREAELAFREELTADLPRT